MSQQNPNSLIKPLKPYFRYSLELKLVHPLMSLMCQSFALQESELRIRDAERDVTKLSLSEPAIKLMPRKLQIDATKHFLK